MAGGWEVRGGGTGLWVCVPSPPGGFGPNSPVWELSCQGAGLPLERQEMPKGVKDAS